MRLSEVKRWVKEGKDDGGMKSTRLGFIKSLVCGVGSGVVLAKTDIQPCTNSSSPITLPPQGCTNLINAPIPKALLAKKAFGECPCGWWPQEAISYALNLELRAPVKFEHNGKTLDFLIENHKQQMV